MGSWELMPACTRCADCDTSWWVPLAVTPPAGASGQSGHRAGGTAALARTLSPGGHQSVNGPRLSWAGQAASARRPAWRDRRGAREQVTASPPRTCRSRNRPLASAPDACRSRRSHLSPARRRGAAPRADVARVPAFCCLSRPGPESLQPRFLQCTRFCQPARKPASSRARGPRCAPVPRGHCFRLKARDQPSGHSAPAPSGWAPRPPLPPPV